MRLGSATEGEAKAFNEELRLAEGLPPLREAEASKAAALARLKIEQENLDREAERAAERARELQARAKQLDADLLRETGFIREAKETLVHLEADLAAIKEAELKAVDEEAGERSELERAEARRVETDAHFAEITHRAAEARAKLRSLEAALAERKDLVATMTRQVASLDAQIQDITSKAPDHAQLSDISERGHALAQEITDIEAETLAAEESGQDGTGASQDPSRRSTAYPSCCQRVLHRTRDDRQAAGDEPTKALTRRPSITSASRRATKRRSAPHSETISKRRWRRRRASTGATSTFLPRIMRCLPMPNRLGCMSRRRRS